MIIINSIEDLILHSKIARKRSGWIFNEEAKILYDETKSFDCAICYECGTKYGFSTMAIALAFKHKGKGKIYTYDTIPQIKLDEGTDLAEFITRGYGKFHENVVKELVNRDSGNALFFIDGDHSVAGITNDWNAILPFIRSGDKIGFHDNRMKRGPGVVKLMESLSVDPKYETTQYETQCRIVFLKVI